MEYLFNKFLKFWKNYQDSWSDEYWKIYKKFSLIQNNCEKSEINYDYNIQILLKKDIEELYIKEGNEENKANNSSNKIGNKNFQKFENLLFEDGKFLKNPNSQVAAFKIKNQNKRLFNVKRSRNTISVGLNRFNKPENILTTSFMDRDRKKNLNIRNMKVTDSSDEDSENETDNNNNKELKAIINDTKRQRDKNKKIDLMKKIDLDIENEISKLKTKGNEILLMNFIYLGRENNEEKERCRDCFHCKVF